MINLEGCFNQLAATYAWRWPLLLMQATKYCTVHYIDWSKHFVRHITDYGAAIKHTRVVMRTVSLYWRLFVSYWGLAMGYIYKVRTSTFSRYKFAGQNYMYGYTNTPWLFWYRNRFTQFCGIWYYHRENSGRDQSSWVFVQDFSAAGEVCEAAKALYHVSGKVSNAFE